MLGEIVMVNKLIFSPHIDDEVLGCGGILNEDSFVLHCGIEDRAAVSAEQRLEEIENVKDFLGFQMKLLRKNIVNTYKSSNLISDFESIINEEKPEYVYIPYPSYNQDHRAVYEAALVAVRPHDVNHFVKKILVYEQPHVFLWDNTYDLNNSFKPNYFVPIDIERKLEAYSILESQVRSFRGVDILKSLAFLRGKQSNYDYAEGYQVLRWVE